MAQSPNNEKTKDKDQCFHFVFSFLGNLFGNFSESKTKADKPVSTVSLKKRDKKLIGLTK
jgi:hypothetical protein